MGFLFLRRPAEGEIGRVLAEQAALPFSYAEVGATRGGEAPAGYPVNRVRGRLGAGRAAFEAASAALASWGMYATGWTWVRPADAQAREGQPFAVLARHYGVWSLNACRVVYALREEGGGRSLSGFAIGTLPGHVEEGEERFTVEWDDRTDEVTYELFAFARPRLRLGGLAVPFARIVQRQFAAASLEAMRREARREAGRAGGGGGAWGQGGRG